MRSRFSPATTTLRSLTILVVVVVVVVDDDDDDDMGDVGVGGGDTRIDGLVSSGFGSTRSSVNVCALNLITSIGLDSSAHNEVECFESLFTLLWLLVSMIITVWYGRWMTTPI